MPSTAHYREQDWPPGLHRRGKWFHYGRMDNGKRVRKPLGTTNKNAAIKLAMEINASFEDKRIPLETALTRDELLFSEVAEKYMAPRQIRESTRKRDTGILRAFYEIAEQILGRKRILLTDVNDDLMGKYIHWRLTRPSSRNGHKNRRRKSHVSIFA